MNYDFTFGSLMSMKDQIQEIMKPPLPCGT